MFDSEISRLPILPPRSPSLLPGFSLKSGFLSGYTFPIAFVGIFALMPILIFVSDKSAQLSFRGTAAEGTVVSVSGPVGASDMRGITYSFMPASGQEFRGTCRCSSNSSYYSVNVGDHVPVRYLPGDPSVNRLAGRSDEPPLFFFLIFPAFALAIFFPVLGPKIKALYQARQAFKNGIITKGSIVFVKRKTASWPNYMPGPSNIYISFRLQSGEMAEGKTICSNEWLITHLPPGAEVNIAYLPENPAQIALLDEFIR